MAKKNQYDASSIQVLEGLEPVRKRPGMYIGSTGIDGLHHMVKEVADNSIDEAIAGFANEVKVELLADGGIRVSDNGRGIPVEKHQKAKKSALELVLTVLHAGGKFDGQGYKASSGLHGVGVSVVNALSIKLVAEVYRDGKIHRQEYSQGQPKTGVEVVGQTSKTGTVISFWPDTTIMADEAFNYEVVLDYLRHQAYLTKGTKTIIVDEAQKKSNAFYFEGGIQSYVRHLNRNREPLGQEIFYVEQIIDEVVVEVAIQYNDSFSENVKAFANNVYNNEGGSHLVGFRTALTRAINDYGRSSGILKEKDSNLTGDDVREGLTAIISVKIKDPQFEGQTKNKLGNPEVRGVVEKTLNKYLGYFFEEKPAIASAIVNKAILSARARQAARAARENIIRKGALDSVNMPGTLSDCSSRSPADSEIFVVEGISAGGTAKSGRDAKYQAILSLRGKVLNVERARLDKMLSNKEIVSLIKAIGTGLDDKQEDGQFNLDGLRYHKIIIMTDADVDGSHITTLLMTFFYRFMRPLVEGGYIYLCQPPTHAIKIGRKNHYVYSDQEFENKVKQLSQPTDSKKDLAAAESQTEATEVEVEEESLEEPETTEEEQSGQKRRFLVTRFKGLGEMQAEQLWETTMDPTRRVLIKVTVEDAERADAIFNQLMGDEVEPRKNFIQSQARFAKNLDI